MEKNEKLKQIPINFKQSKLFDTDTDTRFAKVEIELMHTGLNLNGSIFNKDVVENALPTLVNTPILAFIEENDEGELDFSDHRMTVVRKDNNELDWKYLGSAIGIIPEQYNARWVSKTADDGIEREYLVIDGLLWTKFDDPIEILNRRNLVFQSMELHENYTGYWNNNNQFVFESFSFYGACFLGQDVMPAMKEATAQLQFTQSEDTIKFIESKYNEFITTFTEKGGKSIMEEINNNEEEIVDEVKSEFTEEVKVDETAETEVIESEFTETTEVVEEVVIKTEFVEEVKLEESTEIMYALTHNQLNDEIRNELKKLTHVDKWGDTERKYWLVDVTDTTIIVEDATNNWLLASLSYSTSGDTVSIDESTYSRVKVAYVPLEGSTEQFTLTSERFEVEKSELLEQVTTLKSFERSTLEKELSARFEEQLSEDEINAVFANKESSMEELEKELFSLLGKKNYSVKKVEVNHNKVSVDLGDEQSQPKYNPYEAFFAISKK